MIMLEYNYTFRFSAKNSSSTSSKLCSEQKAFRVRIYNCITRLSFTGWIDSIRSLWRNNSQLSLHDKFFAETRNECSKAKFTYHIKIYWQRRTTGTLMNK